MPDRHGPYRQVRFILEFDNLVKAGFSRCQVPENRTNVVKYREGTDPPRHRKLWGLNEYTPLVLENGVTDDSVALYEWREKVEQGRVDEARQRIAVVLLDEEGEPGPRWEFTHAWPVRYVGPKLDANHDAVAIERLVIAHEGMNRHSPSANHASTQVKATETTSEDAIEEGSRSGIGVKTSSNVDRVKGSQINPTEKQKEEKARSDQSDSSKFSKKKSVFVPLENEGTDRDETERSR